MMLEIDDSDCETSVLWIRVDGDEVCCFVISDNTWCYRFSSVVFVSVLT